ncbi:MAG: nodulation protein NfeD, partial [Gemmatimonadetes bacterium]|nr:nodulation protein NfeD [Gemmatimonadota bacterium]
MRVAGGTGRSGVRSLAACGLALLAMGATARAAPAQARQVVHVVPIHGMIDLGLAPFVQRILDEAKRDSAPAVILDINTFGGRLDAAVVIRDALLSSPVRTVAFINRRAISAGALISLAAERIVMTDGGTIGAATPVRIGQPGSAPAPAEEKSVSYVRKEFRATADSRRRPPLIAEAMVDADVVIPGLIDKGKLLTLTTEEALRDGVADFRANSIDDVLSQLALSGAELRYSSPNWGERLVRLITHPIIASLLLSLAMLGILIEIRTPGFGVPGALGVASLVLLLGGHWIVQLVGWEELLVVGVGLTLLALEIFVIPGFGVAGVVGFTAVLAGLTMGLVGHGATARTLAGAVGRISLSMLAALAASIVLLRYLPRFPLGRRLMLETELRAGGGYASAPQRDRNWLGRVGQTTSALRPAGIAEIDGERVDVVSDGEMIEAGTTIVVS